jgi:hypothetical protein
MVLPMVIGAGDERGAANHIKPQIVLKALKLAKTGEVIELGQMLNSSIPLVDMRRFDLHTKRTFMNPQSNQRGGNEEVVTTEIGQVGTKFDGFALGIAAAKPAAAATCKRSRRHLVIPSRAPFNF